MACHDKSSAIQVHIQVNSENLPGPEKHNVGSLRLPADPSWPKIPQRKLADDAGDIIESPYVVTLTGTPRRSRTVVRTPPYQPVTSCGTVDAADICTDYQRSTSSTRTLKRRPGCIDPRFKRVTNVKSQVGSTDSTEQHDALSEISRSAFAIPMERLHAKEMHRSVPERDTNKQQVTMQEAEKPDETQKARNVENQTELSLEKLNQPMCDDQMDKEILSSKENNKSKVDLKSASMQNCCINNRLDNAAEDTINKNEVTGANAHANETSCYQCVPGLKTSMNDANIQVEIPSLPTQETNGQLIFVVDKKLQSHPVNAIHVDSINIPHECAKQCYNVQVPILTYQSIPVQVRKQGDMRQENVPLSLNAIRESHQCAFESSIRFANPTVCPESVDEVPSRDVQKGVVEEKDIYDEKRNLINVQNIETEKNEENVHIAKHLALNLNANLHKRSEIAAAQRKDRESSDSEYFLPNMNKKNLNSNNLQHLRIQRNVCNGTDEETTDNESVVRRVMSKEQTTHNTQMKIDQNSEMVPPTKDPNQTNPTLKREKMTTTKEPARSYQECMKVINESQRNKSEQNLSCLKGESTGNLLRNSEPYITFQQRKTAVKLSRKTKSYFQKTPPYAILEYSKQERSQSNNPKFGNRRTRKIGHYSSAKVPANEWQNIHANFKNHSNLLSQAHLRFSHDRKPVEKEIGNNLNSSSKAHAHKETYKHDVSPRTNTEDASEKPKGIPLKTQELLNKSYWDYYNKLRDKIGDMDGVQKQYLCQSAIGAPEMKRRKANEMCDTNTTHRTKLSPEFQTLEQCTALSSVINKALDSTIQSSDSARTKQLYLNGNVKAFSSDAIGTRSAIVRKVAAYDHGDTHEDKGAEPIFISQLKRKKDKCIDKQFLELKTIIFFGGMMYILIIFLPMLYDYFYHKEYDKYDVSYVDFILEYVFSSFKEAFGGFFNALSRIFLDPRTCKKCNGIP